MTKVWNPFSPTRWAVHAASGDPLILPLPEYALCPLTSIVIGAPRIIMKWQATLLQLFQQAVNDAFSLF